jgi:predicted  nucleic acid-binding Zn-ribbon protein
MIRFAMPSNAQCNFFERTLAPCSILVQHLPMHPVIKDLLILQERDQKLLIVQRDLDRIPRDEANANGQLSGDQQAMQKAIDALRQCEVATKKIELDIATRRNTILRLKQQQFETRKNEEYTALGNEVIRYTKEIDGLETQELEHMEIADGLRAKLKEAEAQVARSQALVNADLADLTAKKSQLLQRKEELTAERKNLCAGVDPEVLPLYEKLMKSKNGSAVVQASNGMCGGCHMKLVPTTLVKVLAGVEITQCENCGRMLYPD